MASATPQVQVNFVRMDQAFHSLAPLTGRHPVRLLGRCAPRQGGRGRSHDLQAAAEWAP